MRLNNDIFLPVLYCDAGSSILEETAHRDSKSVAVRDFIVYDGLNVDGLQLKVNCDIDQPGEENRDTEKSARKRKKRKIDLLNDGEQS